MYETLFNEQLRLNYAFLFIFSIMYWRQVGGCGQVCSPIDLVAEVIIGLQLVAELLSEKSERVCFFFEVAFN